MFLSLKRSLGIVLFFTLVLATVFGFSWFGALPVTRQKPFLFAEGSEREIIAPDQWSLPNNSGSTIFLSEPQPIISEYPACDGRRGLPSRWQARGP